MATREQDAGYCGVDETMGGESGDRPLDDKDGSDVHAAFAQRVEDVAVVLARDLDLRVRVGVAKRCQEVFDRGSVCGEFAMGEAQRGIPPHGGAASRRRGAGRDVERVPRLHKKRATGRGQAHATRPPLEELDAELDLEIANLF